MSISGRVEITDKFWTDSTGKDVIWARDKDIQTGTYEEQAGGRVKLAASATLTLDVAHITTGQMLHVEVQKANVLVKLNAADHEVPLNPPTGLKARLIIDGTAITSMKLTNASSTTEAEVNWFIAGV